MSTYAYDAEGHPSPQDVLNNEGEGVLQYSGNDRPTVGYINGFTTDTLHHAWIFEGNQDRAVAGTDQENYDNGRSDCAWHETRIPPGEFTYVVACDLNNGDLHGRNTQPYLSGWASETREPGFGQYGSSDAINQGMRLGGKLQKFWGVVNWNPLNYPNNDPHNIFYWISLGVDLIQLIGSPIPGTDQDLVVKPNWWTASAVAPVSTIRNDDMYIGVNAKEGWFVVEGGRISTHFVGSPNAFGIPSDLQSNWLTVPTHALTDADVSALQAVPASGGGGGVTNFDYAAMQRVVTAGVTDGMKNL